MSAHPTQPLVTGQGAGAPPAASPHSPRQTLAIVPAASAQEAFDALSPRTKATQLLAKVQQGALNENQREALQALYDLAVNSARVKEEDRKKCKKAEGPLKHPSGWDIETCFPSAEFPALRKLRKILADFGTIINASPINLNALKKWREEFKNGRQALENEYKKALKMRNQSGEEKDLFAVKAKAFIAHTDMFTANYDVIYDISLPYSELLDLEEEIQIFALSIDNDNVGMPHKFSEAKRLKDKFKEFQSNNQRLFGTGTHSVQEEGRRLNEKIKGALNAACIRLIRKEHRDNLISCLAQYCTLYPDFKEFLPKFLELWEIVRDLNDWLRRPISQAPFRPQKWPENNFSPLAFQVYQLHFHLEPLAKLTLQSFPIKLICQHKVQPVDCHEELFIHTTASETAQVPNLVANLREEAKLRCDAVEMFVTTVAKMKTDLQVFEILTSIAGVRFTEILQRLLVLMRDIQEAKAECKKSTPHDMKQLNRNFSFQTNPYNFKARFKALEEEMHKVSAREFQSLQEKIKSKISTNAVSGWKVMLDMTGFGEQDAAKREADFARWLAEKPLEALFDISTLCSTLSFEMGYMREGIDKGVFPYKNLKGLLEKVWTSSDSVNFKWRGPKPEQASNAD